MRVKYTKDEMGHWHDQVLPARELSEARKTEVMIKMYNRFAPVFPVPVCTWLVNSASACRMPGDATSCRHERCTHVFRTLLYHVHEQ